MPKKISFYFIVPILALAGLLAGLIFHLSKSKYEAYDNVIWMAVLVIGALPLIYRLLRDLLRKHFGVDLIAITAIVSALFLHQYLAGAVIVFMLSGGEALETYALRRARKQLTRLISNAPSVAHIKEAGGLKDVPAAEVQVDDVIVIKPGEAVPVDGLVMAGVSEVDESALTGESLPREKAGSLVLSGSINQENPLELKTVRTAAESKYEQIIKLVKQAEESRAPVVRLADRYSVWFTAITFIMALSAWFIARCHPLTCRTGGGYTLPANTRYADCHNFRHLQIGQPRHCH